MRNLPAWSLLVRFSGPGVSGVCLWAAPCSEVDYLASFFPHSICNSVLCHASVFSFSKRRSPLFLTTTCFLDGSLSCLHVPRSLAPFRAFCLGPCCCFLMPIGTHSSATLSRWGFPLLVPTLAQPLVDPSHAEFFLASLKSLQGYVYL